MVEEEESLQVSNRLNGPLDSLHLTSNLALASSGLWQSPYNSPATLPTWVSLYFHSPLSTDQAAASLLSPPPTSTKERMVPLPLGASPPLPSPSLSSSLSPDPAQIMDRFLCREVMEGFPVHRDSCEWEKMRSLFAEEACEFT